VTLPVNRRWGKVIVEVLPVVAPGMTEMLCRSEQGPAGRPRSPRQTHTGTRPIVGVAAVCGSKNIAAKARELAGMVSWLTRRLVALALRYNFRLRV